MRPLKLKITGFGTFCNYTEIDFEKLGEKGIYLIAGETGSGKTTIFDAITFALYGVASGEYREASQLRSSFALPATPTEVELDFLFKGKKYTVKRNPKYLREKKGGGLGEKTANAEMVLPDGTVIEGIRDVSAKIRDLLGIDENQFGQIMMIAQGQFRDLLNAGTEQRQTIYRKIFKTDKYQILQARISESFSQIKRKKEDNLQALKQYASGILCNSPDFEKFKNGNDFIASDLIEKLEELISSEKEQLNSIEIEKNEVQLKFEKLKESRQKYEELQELEKTLTEHKDNLNSKNIEYEEFQKELNKSMQKEKIITEKQNLCAVLKASLESYTSLENLKEKFTTLCTKITNNENEKQNISDKHKILEKKLTEGKEELASLLDSDAKKEQLLNAQFKIESKIKIFEDLQSEIETFKNENKKMETALQEYLTEKENYRQLDEKYKKVFSAYMNAQAGILAQQLEREKPCPVCGSTHHPSPANFTENTVSKSEFDIIKNSLEEERTKINEKSLEAGNLKGIVEKSLKFIEESLSAELNTCSINEGETILQKRITEAKEELADLKQSIETEEQRISRKEQIQRGIPIVEQSLYEIQEKLKSIEKSLAHNSAEKNSVENEIKELKNKLEFEDINHAENKIFKLEKEIEILKTEISETEENLNNCSKFISNLSGAIKQIEQQIAKVKENFNSKLDIEKILNEKENTEKIFTELSENIKILSGQIMSNTEILKNIKKQTEIQKKISKEFEMLSSLHKTASGNISGSKIQLETYIQTAFFKRIIQRANKRFMMMSGGQFEFVAREIEKSSGNSKAGLDLDIIDHFKNGRRQAKTLSGGESFEAALSLALALADEIQHSAGGIQFDCMFIDEGFGGLSPEHLNQAFKALSSVSEANKLIGIISHIEELENRIEKKIRVIKNPYGSGTVRIEV